MNVHQNWFQARVVIQVAVKANQYRRQTNEAVQNRHQLRHLGHFNFFRQADTNCAADDHRHQNPGNIAGIRAKNRRDQRNRHPGDTVVVTLLRGFVFGKSRQAENKQDRGNNVCSCN